MQILFPGLASDQMPKKSSISPIPINLGREFEIDKIIVRTPTERSRPYHLENLPGNYLLTFTDSFQAIDYLEINISVNAKCNHMGYFEDSENSKISPWKYAFKIPLFTSHFINSESLSKDKYEFTFVLDCSGSMDGSRMSTAKFAMQMFLSSLPTDSLVNIYRFGTDFTKLFQVLIKSKKNS